MSYQRSRHSKQLVDKWRRKAFSGIEAELSHEEYQGFEEGNLRFTKMNGEYQSLFDSRFLKFDKPRREGVLESGLTEVTVCSTRFEIIVIFSAFCGN